MSRVAIILAIMVVACGSVAYSADTGVSSDHAADSSTTEHTTTVHKHRRHHHFHPVNEASRIIHHPVHETSEAIHDATGTKPERPKPDPYQGH
jgi:hypothetical protein